MRHGDIVFNGQQAFVTMELDPGTKVGDAVTHTGPGKAGRGTDGQPLLGKVQQVEYDGLGTVAIQGAGFIDIPAVGTLSTGFQSLVVDGTGKVKVGANGSRHLVNLSVAGLANVRL